jgi:hypothetical protein
MTTLYPNVARWSTLIPGVWEPEWTATDHVLSDQVPGVAGSGAVQIAARALNLSLGDAAKLVASKGEASNLSATTLISAATAANQGLFGAPGASFAGAGANPLPGSYAGRIPIPSSVQTQTALLGGDAGRVSLLIQNNNASGDAVLLVSVDGPVDTANPAFYLNLPAGQGIFMSENAFTNPIYVAWGSGNVAGGVLFYGSAIATQGSGTRPAPASSGGGAWYSPPYSSF